MKRNAAGALVLLAALGGCMSPEPGRTWPAYGVCPGRFGAVPPPPVVPGVQSATGAPVPMAQPYAMHPPLNNTQAYQMMAQSVPLNVVQTGATAYPNAAAGSGVIQAGASFPADGSVPGTAMPPGGLITPPGVPFTPGMGAPGMPSGSGLMQAGMQSGIMMPSPGGATVPGPGFVPPPGAVAAVGGQSCATGSPFPVKRTQVRFVRPSGMKVAWLAPGPDGRPMYAPNVLEAPGRYNFLQAAIYRIKLSNIEGRPGLEVYPTLEVVPANHKTEAFLAHSAVPLEFTEEDFNQIAAGNYVVKVIYLPDPQFQEVAATGIEEISSTRLEPGADPIVEALRRGSILLVIRMGNMDQEAQNTPPIDAPAPGAAAIPPGLMPGMAMGHGAMPYGMGPGGAAMLPPSGALGAGAPPGLRLPPPGAATGQADPSMPVQYDGAPRP